MFVDVVVVELGMLGLALQCMLPENRNRIERCVGTYETIICFLLLQVLELYGMCPIINPKDKLTAFV